MDRRSFLKKASLFTAMNIFCVENIFAKNIGTFDSAELAFKALGISLKDGNYFAGMGDILTLNELITTIFLIK